MINPIQLTPGMDQATILAAINNVFRQIEQENRTKIVKDEDGVDRIILGRNPDGSYGLRVSQPGKDVNTAEGSDLIFNSNQNIFKIVKVGNGEAPAIHTYETGTNTYQGIDTNLYPHGLDYAPAIIAYVEDGGGEFVALPYTTTYALGPGGGIGVSTFTASADATNVSLVHNVVEYGDSGEGDIPAVNIKYYLLQESAG